MTGSNRIIEMAKSNDGLVSTKMVVEAGISKWSLDKLEREGELFRVARGLYVTEDGWVDDYFLNQLRFPKGIYSHETALFLHGYSDRIPLQMVMTFPYGTNVKNVKAEGIIPYVVRRELELGIVEVQSETGHSVKVYDIERTIVDLINPRYNADIEQLIPAIKQYMRSEKRDVQKLIDYARIFKVDKKVKNYLEVLL
jgi:predicted transcriptional regulator of viral defense system